MSSIVSSVVSYDSGGDDGRRVEFTVTLLDNDDVSRVMKIGPVITNAAYDATTNAAIIGNIVFTVVKRAEVDGASDAVYDGSNPLTISDSPQWVATKRMRKELVRFMMRSRDPRFTVLLMPLMDDLLSRYNDTQLESRLDFSAARVQRMKRRYNAIVADIDTVQQNLIDFDDEEEEEEEEV